MASTFEPPCSDDAVKAKTGRDWAEWRALLDAEGGAKLTHAELARLIHDKHGAGGWWSQMVAVGYERLKGRRAVNARSDGSYSASASKTLPIAAASAHAMFVDGRKRAGWLKERIVIRTAVAPRSVRITWPDQTNVLVWITAKDASKCVVAIEHTKLPDAAAVAASKAFWSKALAALAAVAR